MNAFTPENVRLAERAEEEFSRLTQSMNAEIYEEGRGRFKSPLHTVRDVEHALRNRHTSAYGVHLDHEDGLALIIDTKALPSRTRALLLTLATVIFSAAFGWLACARIA